MSNPVISVTDGQVQLADGMDEDTGHRIFTALRNRFGWAAILYMRGDAESAWDAQYEEAGVPDADRLPFDEAAWAAVQDSWHWYKGIPQGEGHMSAINDCLEEALREAKATLAAGVAAS